MSEVAEEKDSGIQRFIKSATETLTILGIGSYIAGFLIVNSYLLTFGYAPYSLFRTTYLSAGVLFLFFIAPIILSMYSLHLGFRLTQKGNSQRARVSIGTLGILFFSFTMVLRAIGTSEMQNDPEEWLPNSWQPWLALLGLVSGTILIFLENIGKQWWLAEWAKQYRGLWLVTMYLSILVAMFRMEIVFYCSLLSAVVFQVVRVASQKDSLLDRLRDWPPNVVAEMMIPVIVLPILVGLFGTDIYGKIKAQYGGGHPSRVRVLIQPDRMAQLSVGSGQKNLSTMLAEAQLLDSSDNKLLVLLKSSHGDKGLLMQIDRSLIDAVVYLPLKE